MILINQYKSVLFWGGTKNQYDTDKSVWSGSTDNIMPDACTKFQNYPMKTVGGDAFYSYYILYDYFTNFKNSPKIQK